MSAPTSSVQVPTQHQVAAHFVGAPSVSVPAAFPTTPAAAATTSASLYVGELDPSVTEAMLFEMFNMVGPVASIRVCRDAVTRRSLGYAYVNFHNIADGERALETLNYTIIKGKACRIMWSQRDPNLRKTGAGNVFIKNLDPTIDNKALHDTFSAFGNILSCKVVTEDGMSKGFGFVHYETYEAAENAIKNVNGMLLNDNVVFVGHHIAKKERQSKVDEMKSNFTNVYVKNLDLSVTNEELFEKFAAFGVVTSCVVSTDEDGKPRGFGFVNFEDHEAASRAVDALNDLEWKEKKMFVSRAQKKGEREEELKRQYETAKLEKLSQYQGVNLYIKNLEDDIDDEKLRQEFSVYGAITSAKVMRDEKGASKGFGFVCFASPDEATKAVTEMNGRMVGQKPIYVALAQRKDVRRNQLESQLSQRNQMQTAVQGGMPGRPIYPGAPIYFAGPQPGFPQPRGFMPGQPAMQPRPRWAPNGQQQPMMPGMPPQSYPNMPMQFNGAMSGNFPGGRPPRSAPHPNNRSGVPEQLPSGPGGPPSGLPQSHGVNPNRGGFKYRPSTRNQPPTSPPSGSIPATSTGKSGLTAAALASAPPEAQKQMLGEQIYPLIADRQPELAGKITGMLLEMDNSELLHLIENPEALDSKVAEAVTVLKQHSSVDSA